MDKKKYIYFTISLFAAFFSACSEDGDFAEKENADVNVNIDNDYLVFSASNQDENITRAVFSGSLFKWESSDIISVKKHDTRSSASSFSVKENSISSSGQYVEFEGTMSTNASDVFYAVYPSSDKTKFTTSSSWGTTTTTLSSSIPYVQNVEAAGGVDMNAIVMTGYTTVKQKTFAFKNVTALLKIQIKSGEQHVKSVRFVSNNTGKKLVGDFTASISTEGIASASVTDNTNAKNSVVLKAADDSDLNGTYYLSVLPATLDKGFTLLIETAFDGENGQKIYQRTSKASLTIERSTIIDLGYYNASNDNVDGAKNISSSFVPNVVDLDLASGTVWSTTNIGATSTKPNGEYYAWGELEPQTVYNWRSYKWGDPSQTGSDNTFSTAMGQQGVLYRYNSADGLGLVVGYNYTGYWLDRSYPADNKDELAREDDVVYQESGGVLNMPSWNQVNELWGNTTKSKEDNSFKFTSAVGRYIKLGIGGYMENSASKDATYACYWTKDRSDTDRYSYQANRFDISNASGNLTSSRGFLGSDNAQNKLYGASRAQGRFVRGVLRNEAVSPTYNY